MVTLDRAIRNVVAELESLRNGTPLPDVPISEMAESFAVVREECRHRRLDAIPPPSRGEVMVNHWREAAGLVKMGGR